MKNFTLHQKIWIYALVYTILNIIQGFFTPLINDEAYYWVWSQKLDWGYFDHPPLVALWSFLGFSILENELGVRLVAIIFGGLGFVLLSKILKIKTDKELNLYTFLFFSIVLFQVFGFINTPDAPLLFFTIFYFYSLQRFFQRKNIPDIILLGIAMALLIYSKYHGILVIVFSLLPHTFKLLKSKYIYLSIFVGIICYIPHIYWQWENDFVSLQYHLVNRNVNNVFKWNYPVDYILNVVLVSSPLLFVYHFKAFFKTNYTTAFQKSLLWTVAGIIGFFILISFKRYIQAQWSLVAFVPLLVITYHYYKENTKAYTWIKKLTFVTLLLLSIGRVYFVIENPPINTQYHGWKSFMQKAGDITKGVAVFEKYQYTSLYNFYNYPDKKAVNFKTLENRENQYNLWDSEKEIFGKEITYISKYIASKDSLILEPDNPGAIFYYKNIPTFVGTDDVYFDIKKVTKYNQKVILKTEIINNGKDFIELNPNLDIGIQQIFVDKPMSDNVLCAIEISFSKLKLYPNQPIVIDFEAPICNDLPSEFTSYIGISYQGIPPKKQSNYISQK